MSLKKVEQEQEQEKTKIGKCIDCVYFVYENNNVKQSSCEIMTEYVTKTALLDIFCRSYTKTSDVMPIYCDYCGDVLIREPDSDIGDDLKPFSWISVYCPRISVIESDESIKDNIARIEMERHFSDTY